MQIGIVYCVAAHFTHTLQSYFHQTREIILVFNSPHSYCILSSMCLWFILQCTLLSSRLTAKFSGCMSSALPRPWQDTGVISEYSTCSSGLRFCTVWVASIRRLHLYRCCQGYSGSSVAFRVPHLEVSDAILQSCYRRKKTTFSLCHRCHLGWKLAVDRYLAVIKFLAAGFHFFFILSWTNGQTIFFFYFISVSKFSSFLSRYYLLYFSIRQIVTIHFKKWPDKQKTLFHLGLNSPILCQICCFLSLQLP